MGVFLFSTYELDSTGINNQDRVFRKVLDYIVHNLNDINWQESISKKTRNNAKSQRIIKIYLRAFNKKRIEENNLKSYAKYSNKEKILIIDAIFSLDLYKDLNEIKFRKTLCKDICFYLKDIIVKYKDSFKDFDVTTFIPLLENRFEEIESENLPYSGSNELEDLLKGLLD